MHCYNAKRYKSFQSVSTKFQCDKLSIVEGNQELPSSKIEADAWSGISLERATNMYISDHITCQKDTLGTVFQVH